MHPTQGCFFYQNKEMLDASKLYIFHLMDSKEKSFDLPRVLFLLQDLSIENLDIDERIIAYNTLRSKFLGISFDVSPEEVVLMSQNNLELVLGLIPLLIRENPEAIPAIAQALIPR